MSTLDSYIQGIRARGISDADLDTDAVSAIITEALTEYSRCRPVVSMAIFATVADQAAYSWTDIGDEGGRNIREVLWNPSGSAFLTEFLVACGYDAGLHYYHMPSQAIVEQIKAVEDAKLRAGKWYVDGDNLVLTPRPSEDFIDVLVVYESAYADVTEIPDADRDIFLDLVESNASKVMVNTLARISAATRIKTPEYEIQMGEQIGYWRKNAKELRATFLSKIDAGTAAVGRT